jgi:hypothetical protein
MELKEVRRNLLAQHDSLRRLMAELEGALEREQSPAPAIKALRDALHAHNVAEEAVLGPILSEIDVWGPERVKQMIEEHKVEHALLVHRLDPAAAPDAIRAVLSELRAHMAHEEEHTLSEELLKDDVVNVDAD